MTSLGVVISQQEFFSQHFTRPPGPLSSMLTTTGLRDTRRGMVLTFHHDKKAVRVYTQTQGIIVFLLPTILYIGISATNTERPRQRSGVGGNEPAELMAEREIVEPTIIKVQFTSVSRPLE